MSARTRTLVGSPMSLATTSKLLSVEDLRIAFKTPAGLVRAVDGVSIAIDKGETLGIVGESGSGKTVLSRAIMGLLPKQTTERSGSVVFRGEELLGRSDNELRRLWGRDMAMVFQDPMTSLNPVKRIGTQITEGLRLHLGLSKTEANLRAIEGLRAVGIPEADRRVRQYPHQLSGGMRQRVTIAIALACGPTLLFADEPTTALDVTVQAQILDLLKREQESRDMAMVLVTHDLGVVSGRTDRIAVMYGGKLVETAPTRTLFSSMKMPYTEALLKAIPKTTGPTHARLEAIPGRPPDLVDPPPGCRFSPRCPYAQARCLVEEPPLRWADSGDHQFACWYPLGSPEWEQARDRNMAGGTTAAGVSVAEGID